MKKYIIRWNIGFGDYFDVVECNSLKEAEDEAYEFWREEAEQNSDFGVVGEYTKELAEKCELQEGLKNE